MPRFRARKSFTIGHPQFGVRVTINQSGKRSWSLRLWRYTYSLTRGTHGVDTPGPGAIYWGGRKAGRR